MLEGSEGDKGYFITFTINHVSEDEAIQLSLEKAEEIGLEIIGLEEVEVVNLNQEKKIGLENMTGKSFFDLR